MCAWRGDLARAEKLAAHPAPGLPNLANLHAWALAGFEAARGSAAASGQLLRTALARAAGGPYTPLLLSRLIELGPAPETDALLAELVEATASLVSPWATTTVARTLGLVHHDRTALADAISSANAGGLVFERARAQLLLGELVTDEVAALTEAYQTFARLGTHGLGRRARHRLRELGAKVPRHRSPAAGLLTESQERVARLVQQGMRNRDIAEALHYSPRSVEVYLSRIYAKLRVSSRLELARKLDAMDAMELDASG